jgi:DNA-binding NarL/FixJ family response regulator
MIETPPPDRDLRVLVADDDEDLRFVLRRLLARQGIRDVQEAADGEAALEVARSGDLDLIVLDLAMPGRSGIEVLPDLQAAVPGTPVVVLSGYQRERMGHLVMERGAVGYVEKRVPPERLVTEILLAAALTDQAGEAMAAAFPADVSAVPRARDFVRDLLGTQDAELVATVELLVSELVTNAVVHASSAPRVEVALDGDTARVQVYDDDPALPTAGEASTSSLGGRGLFLVEQLATRWGTEPHGDGKVIWFELDRP